MKKETAIKTGTKTKGDGIMKTKTDVKAGTINHNETLAVRSDVKAGTINHNETLAVRTDVKAGVLNHNETLTVRSDVKAGALNVNHNETLAVRSDVQECHSIVGADRGRRLVTEDLGKCGA